MSRRWSPGCGQLRYEGYEVISAGDGVAGLERVFADEPDLVVLDVMMPRMSGLECASR